MQIKPLWWAIIPTALLLSVLVFTVIMLNHMSHLGQPTAEAIQAINAQKLEFVKSLQCGSMDAATFADIVKNSSPFDIQFAVGDGIADTTAILTAAISGLFLICLTVILGMAINAIRAATVQPTARRGRPSTIKTEGDVERGFIDAHR